MNFRIDGVRMKLESPDLDGDGVMGGLETIKSNQDRGVMQIKENTELGEALDLQNRDIENSERLSSVDFISRINNFQHAPLVAVDTLCAMKVISRDARIVVRNIMRKSVSLDGKGRKEFVELVTGKKELEIKRQANNLMGHGQGGQR